MNITVKSWMILSATLFLGMLIGTMLPFGPGHYGSRGSECSYHGKGFCHGKHADCRSGGKGFHHGNKHGKHGHKGWGKRHNPEWMLRKMERRLDLTDEQMEKIKPVFETHSEKMQAAMSHAHDSMKVLFRDFYKEIKPILTEEQTRKLEKLMERHGKKKWRRH